MKAATTSGQMPVRRNGKAAPDHCPVRERRATRKGFIIPLNYSHLEDGTMGPAPSLLIVTRE